MTWVHSGHHTNLSGDFNSFLNASQFCLSTHVDKGIVTGWWGLTISGNMLTLGLCLLNGLETKTKQNFLLKNKAFIQSPRMSCVNSPKPSSLSWRGFSSQMDEQGSAAWQSLPSSIQLALAKHLLCAAWAWETPAETEHSKLLILCRTDKAEHVGSSSRLHKEKNVMVGCVDSSQAVNFLCTKNDAFEWGSFRKSS